MKAAVIKGPFHMEIEERSIPVPKPGEVLIRVKAVGICGSDVHGFKGESGTRRQPGLIMGHEAAGIVESVGDGVLKWKNGDRIVIDPQKSCGDCYPCKHGWPNLCDNMTLIGSSMRKFLDGAMSEFVVVSEKQLLALPDNLSFSEGATLDPVGNAMHIFNRAGGEVGDTVAIIGTGAIGLMAVQMAKLRGAGKVIAVDTSDKRLELAKQCGADCVINALNEDVVERILAETEGRGADIVVEAVGIHSTYKNAVRSARKRGKVLALGFHSDEIEIPIQPLLFREITIIGCTGFVFEAQPVLDLLSQGKLNVKMIITHELKLEDVQKGFQMLADGSPDAIKVMLIP